MKKYNYTVDYKDCKNGDDTCLKRKVLGTRSEVAHFLNEITEMPLYTPSQIDRYFRCPPKNNKIDALKSKFTLRRDPWIKESSAK